MSKRPVIARPSYFQIQLLADKSVVLVEKHGHESEIFMPELHNGRITLKNVVCSRQPRPRPSELSCLSAMHRCQRIANQKLTKAAAGLMSKKASLVAVARTGPPSKVAFELKIISKGNVVLAECNGYESEIFLPYISSHCVAMKRICAGELAQCVFRRSNNGKQSSTSNAAASKAASLAAQAVDISKFLINPIQLIRKEQKKVKEQKTQKIPKVLKEHIEKSPPVSHKKKPPKHHSHEAGDA